LGQGGGPWGPGFGMNPGQWPGPPPPTPEPPPPPPPPKRCPTTEPKGAAGWKPQTGLGGALSECLFHGGNECYREDVATSSAQCCYDKSGKLTGGDEDKVNPDYDFWGHIRDDVIPHFF
jgi:hypothetical protein